MSPVDVFLIRGLARETAHWGEFYDLLKKEKSVASVHGLDLLGAGCFNQLTSPLSITENAQFLISQIPKKTEHPRVIVSVSLGSMVAIEMCQLRPDLFAKVFVMNTSFSNLSPVYHRLQLKALRNFYSISQSKSLEQRELQVLKMVSQKTEKHEEIAKEWAQVARDRPMTLQNFLRQLVAASRYKIAEQAPQTPIVVFNSLMDEMVNPSCSEKLAKHWDLPIFTHPSAGHDICIDDPLWVLQKIRENVV